MVEVVDTDGSFAVAPLLQRPNGALVVVGVPAASAPEVRRPMTAPELAVIVLGLTLAIGLLRAGLHADANVRARRLRRAPWRLPARARSMVAARLARAEVAIEPEAALRWWGAGVVAAAWFALVLVAGPPSSPPCSVAAGAGPVALRLRRRPRRSRVHVPRCPGVLDQVVAHLRAGGTVPEAVARARGTPGAARRRTSRRIAARLESRARRSRNPSRHGRPNVRSAGCGAAAGALAMVITVGGSAATPLEGLAASLRNDEAAAGEARALSAQARISAVVVGGAPLAFLVFSSATDPASVQVLVGSTIGRICLALGLGLEALAALVDASPGRSAAVNDVARAGARRCMGHARGGTAGAARAARVRRPEVPRVRNQARRSGSAGPGPRSVGSMRDLARRRR